MRTEFGRPYGTHAHDAGIDRPSHGEEDRIEDHAQLAESAESTVSDMAGQARPTVSRAADVVESLVKEAPGYVRSAVVQARDKMTEYREHGWERVHGDVVEYTRSRPLAALGMAAAIGLLLGRLSSTARR